MRAAPDRRRPGGGSGGAAYALMLVSAFFVYATAGSPVPVAAELRDRIGLEGSEASLFMLPFAGGFAVGCVLWFALGRHAPGRVLLPLALALLAGAGAALIAAPSPAWAGGARAVVGLASAGFPAAAQAVITRITPPGARGRMIGGFAAAVVTGGILGQALVGGLADLTSAPVALALVTVAAPLAAAGAMRAALPRETGHGHLVDDAPLAVRHLLRAQWPTLAVAALLFGTYWLMLAQLAQAVRADRFALSAGETGLLPVLGVAGAFSTMVTGWVADRRGTRPPTVATIVAGIAVLAVTIPGGAPLWLFAAGYGGFVAAYWGFLPPGSSEVTHRAAPRDRQPALMAFYAAAWIGASAFTALGTVLHGWAACAAVTLGAWAIAAAIAVGSFGRHGPHASGGGPDGADHVPSTVGAGSARRDA